MGTEITVGSPRSASTPTVGALRDAVRTILGFVAAWLITKMLDAQTAANLSPTVDAAIVVIVSALFAFAGKWSRDKEGVIGKAV